MYEVRLNSFDLNIENNKIFSKLPDIIYVQQQQQQQQYGWIEWRGDRTTKESMSERVKHGMK